MRSESLEEDVFSGELLRMEIGTNRVQNRLDIESGKRGGFLGVIWVRMDLVGGVGHRRRWHRMEIHEARGWRSLSRIWAVDPASGRPSVPPWPVTIATGDGK